MLLPWLCGCVWVRLFLARPGCGNVYIVLGHGYFLGVFTTTALIGVYHTLAGTLEFYSIVAILFALLVVGVTLLWMQAKPVRTSREISHLPVWQKLVAFVLLAMLAWRHIHLLQELITRPVYAWDAWMNWLPKSVVWYHHNELSLFVAPDQWLKQPAIAEQYTLGNTRASTYPPMVPLIILWNMMAAQTSDHSLILLPWLFAPVCLGFALYGHLRLAGAPFLTSIIACYILLSLPYVNVHTVLAGYADLWLASAVGMAVFSIRALEDTDCSAYAWLCLFYAIACSQLKQPGLVFFLIILLALVRSRLRIHPRKEALIAAAMVAITAVLLVAGLDLELPGGTRLSLTLQGIEVPTLGYHALEYRNVSPAIIESLFQSFNWHIAWFGMVLFLLARLWTTPSLQRVSTEAIVLLLAFAFIGFTFYFTKHYKAALNFTTLNRAILYAIPSLVFYLALSFVQFSTKRKHLMHGK